jgi:hypothetical protein
MAPQLLITAEAMVAEKPKKGDSHATHAAPDQEELKALSAHLADVRQRVDEIAAQLALQEVEQDILAKISARPPRPAAAPVRKSVPLPPLAQPAH